MLVLYDWGSKYRQQFPTLSKLYLLLSLIYILTLICELYAAAFD